MSARTRRESGPVLPFAKAFQRSISPLPTRTKPIDTYSSPLLPYRSTSPTRVNLHGFTSTVRLSSNRPIAATSSHMSNIHNNGAFVKKQSRTCMCSPTTHPGSFRCSLHKNNKNNNNVTPGNYLPNRLNARRSAMANSLVRIGTVEGDLVRRALAQLIRPSSHQQKRRGAFQPRPSRLSVMSKAND